MYFLWQGLCLLYLYIHSWQRACTHAHMYTFVGVCTHEMCVGRVAVSKQSHKENKHVVFCRCIWDRHRLEFFLCIVTLLSDCSANFLLHNDVCCFIVITVDFSNGVLCCLFCNQIKTNSQYTDIYFSFSTPLVCHALRECEWAHCLPVAIFLERFRLVIF